MTNEITIIEKEVSKVVSQEVTITDTNSLKLASEKREWLKDKIKFLKNHKEVLYRPYKDKIDQINEVYKPIEKMLTDAEKATSSAMSTYQTQILKDKQEAEAKIASRIGEGKGHLKIETAMSKIDALEAPIELDSTGFVKKQVLVITNVNLIPKEYLIVNEKAVELALKAGVIIPGATLEVLLIPRSK